MGGQLLDSGGDRHRAVTVARSQAWPISFST